MKIAVIQMGSGPDKARNLKKAYALVQKAARQGARFIALPEVFTYRGPRKKKEGYSFVAENIPGPATILFQQLAKQRKIFILLGSLYEKIPGSRKVYNTSILIHPSGRILAKYRKIHLFEAKLGKNIFHEPKFLRPGSKFATAKIEGWVFGLSICYDLRFPELYRQYAKAGANVLCVPSSFTRPTGKAHFETLLRARAIENICYVIAPDQISRIGQGIPSYGNSMIIDPWGKILARASGDQEQIIYADLDLAVLKAKRKSLPGISRPGG